ncbi:MAG TPA: class I SAM-dependent methyltransferase [Nevskia sp.]|nr:class I SAM-dependent methyltransferase [Nevskia sp.]
MTDRSSSRTALAVAWLRAAHQVLEAAPRILEDPVAVPLLGGDTAQRIRAGAPRFQTAAARGLRSHVVLRSRHAEEQLRRAVARGAVQYVLLGAGYDTFALRQPDWARPLRIFEVDHPGSQAEKRRCMAQAGLEAPANLRFAPVDFERESLLDGLRRHRIDPSVPTFFAWLGVTMYLSKGAVAATLCDTAAFAPGSGIVLTFAAPRGSDADAEAVQSGLAQRAAAAGEPWLSHYDPGEIEAALCQAGYGEVDFLTPQQARARYYEQRPADLPPPTRVNLVCAWR